MSDFKVTGINTSATGETFVAEVEAGLGQVERRTINVEHLLLMLEPDCCADDKFDYLKTLEFKTSAR